MRTILENDTPSDPKIRMTNLSLAVPNTLPLFLSILFQYIVCTKFCELIFIFFSNKITTVIKSHQPSLNNVAMQNKRLLPYGRNYEF